MWQRFNNLVEVVHFESEVEQILQSGITSGSEMKICVGTDSQKKRSYTEFATVIVILRIGFGGQMLIRKMRYPNFNEIHSRLQKEVTLSIETAYNLHQYIEKYNIPIEIHADINSNPKYKSYTSLNSAYGYAVGMGFEFKCKPDAFASTCCANRLVQ